MVTIQWLSSCTCMYLTALNFWMTSSPRWWLCYSKFDSNVDCLDSYCLVQLDCLTAILLFAPKFQPRLSCKQLHQLKKVWVKPFWAPWRSHEKRSSKCVLHCTVQCDRLLTALSLASRKSDNLGTVSSSLLICKLQLWKLHIEWNTPHVPFVKFQIKTFFISKSKTP